MENDAGSGAEPADLAQWSLHCYCPSARETPHTLVRTGSNGRLLHAARGGTTLTEVRARGIPVTDGQLARLVEFGLLTVAGEQVRTAFAALGPDTMTSVRRLSRTTARQLAERIVPDVHELHRMLSARGQAGSGYAMVFGHALDGLLWTRLRARDAVPRTALTAERPWWNGAFWAVYPGRDASAGTNFVDCGDGTLVLVWTGTTVRELAVLGDAEGVRATVAGLVTGASSGAGVVTDQQGREWRLRLPDGRPAIPVVGDGGELDVVAGRIADAVADALVGDDLAAARELIEAAPPVATVVLAHELIWEITEALIGVGALAVPAAHQGQVTTETLTELVYVTVGEF